jgi:hypothetical protein
MTFKTKAANDPKERAYRYAWIICIAPWNSRRNMDPRRGSEGLDQEGCGSHQPGKGQGVVGMTEPIDVPGVKFECGYA